MSRVGSPIDSWPVFAAVIPLAGCAGQPANRGALFVLRSFVSLCGVLPCVSADPIGARAGTNGGRLKQPDKQEPDFQAVRP